MVKVEELKEKDTSNVYANSDASSSTTSLSSVSSDVSDVSDVSPDSETFVDRLTALVDIVPPRTRASIKSKVSSTASFFGKTGKVFGNIAWVITTSALLVALPLALSLEQEAAIIQQERELEGQKEGQAVS